MKRYSKKSKARKSQKSQKSFRLTAKRVKKTKKVKSQIKCGILQFSVNSRQKHESLNKGKK